MPSSKENKIGQRNPASWRRFFIGAMIFFGVIYCFTLGVTPPGPLGEVVRHNQAQAIDATPYFYSEVENIVELQAGLERWWGQSDSTQTAGKISDPTLCHKHLVE